MKESGTLYTVIVRNNHSKNVKCFSSFICGIACSCTSSQKQIIQTEQFELLACHDFLNECIFSYFQGH